MAMVRNAQYQVWQGILEPKTILKLQKYSVTPQLQHILFGKSMDFWVLSLQSLRWDFWGFTTKILVFDNWKNMEITKQYVL